MRRNPSQGEQFESKYGSFAYRAWVQKTFRSYTKKNIAGAQLVNRPFWSNLFKLWTKVFQYLVTKERVK